MKNETYNGWSNYNTWRVKLELIDTEVETIKENKETFTDISELAETLKNECEMYIGLDNNNSGIAYDYAMAFLSDVNWYEIAESVAEDYPGLIETK